MAKPTEERRRAPRIPLLVRVECKTGRKYVLGHCENINETGMLVSAAETFDAAEAAEPGQARQDHTVFKSDQSDIFQYGLRLTIINPDLAYWHNRGVFLSDLEMEERIPGLRKSGSHHPTRK